MFRTVLPTILLCLYLFSCDSPKKTRTFYAMGGIPVNIIAAGLSDATLQRVTDQAARTLEEWESELSMYRESSAIHHLHKNPDMLVYLSENGWQALQAAREAERITSHAFDVTIGPVVHLWKQAQQKGIPPDNDAIRSALECTGFDYLVFNENDRSVQVKKPDHASSDTASGQSFILDVGGIAKGLFAEWLNTRIVESLSPGEKSGLKKLIVDLAGDMYVRSFSSDDTCHVGIRDPFTSEKSTLWGVLSVNRGAVVTSGTYERFFEIGGERYCHIIDPETGYPVSGNLVSVTIVDPSGAMADALATAIFVLGESRGIELVESREQTEMVLIRNDGTFYVTKGLQDRLKRL